MLDKVKSFPIAIKMLYRIGKEVRWNVFRLWLLLEVAQEDNENEAR